MAEIIERVRERLFALADEEYREFQGGLIPTVDADRMIGVRTPALRSLAKELGKDPEISAFLAALPHRYFDENQLHAFLISLERDYDRCLAEVDRFLPFVDNWATCDQLSPKVFAKHRDRLIGEVRRWMGSELVFTVRFGIGMLMQHYLDSDFRPEHLDWVAALRSEEYYVNMMRAWYFATALAKQYPSAIRVIEEQRLDLWTHNKAIQKARESRRITEEQKAYLNTLKVK